MGTLNATDMIAKTDWFATGQALILLLIGALTAWNAWRAKKSAAVLAEVHKLTNSAMTIQKLQLAEVTAAKAAITHNAADQIAADKAMTDYTESIKLDGRQGL